MAFALEFWGPLDVLCFSWMGISISLPLSEGDLDYFSLLESYRRALLRLGKIISRNTTNKIIKRPCLKILDSERLITCNRLGSRTELTRWNLLLTGLPLTHRPRIQRRHSWLWVKSFFPPNSYSVAGCLRCIWPLSKSLNSKVSN